MAYEIQNITKAIRRHASPEQHDRIDDQAAHRLAGFMSTLMKINEREHIVPVLPK